MCITEKCYAVYVLKNKQLATLITNTFICNGNCNYSAAQQVESTASCLHNFFTLFGFFVCLFLLPLLVTAWFGRLVGGVNFPLYHPSGNGHILSLGSRMNLKGPEATPVACFLTGVGVLACLLPVWHHYLPFQVQEPSPSLSFSRSVITRGTEARQRNRKAFLLRDG